MFNIISPHTVISTLIPRVDFKSMLVKNPTQCLVLQLGQEFCHVISLAGGFYLHSSIEQHGCRRFVYLKRTHLVKL